MSARSRRKRYTPRRNDPSGGLYAIERRQPLAEGAIRDIALISRSAFEKMRTGRGDTEDLFNVGFASNVALLLTEGGFGRECEPEIKAAQAALLRAHDRLTSVGRVGLDGPGIAEISNMLDVFEAQLDAAIVGDMVDVLREIHRRVEAGLVANSAAEFRSEACA